jgi:ATP:ADP antiporter, AAA family
MFYKALRKATNLQPEEVQPLLTSFAYFFFLLCSYYMLRPLRDAMGLTGGVRDFQWLFTATFLVMLAAVPLFGAIVARLPPRRFVPLIYRSFVGIILGFGALFALGWQEVAVARVFFVWMSVFNLFVVSIFWSVLVDVFRNDQAKRLFGFIAAGGTVGALVGPGLTAYLAGTMAPAALTVIAAGLLEAAVRCVLSLTNDAHEGRAAGRHALGEMRIGGNAFAGLGLLVRSRYLFGIVLYMLLFTTTSTFLYLEQARIVAAKFSDTGARTQFFAVIDFAVSCLTLFLQVALTARVIRRFGVPIVLALLPLLTAVALAAIAILPTLVVLTFMQAFRRAVDYAFARPGHEVLFTVVDRESKYKAKSAIETFVFRGGDAASSWIYSGLAALGLSFPGVALVTLPFVGAWIGLAIWLGRSQDEIVKVQGRTEHPQLTDFRDSDGVVSDNGLQNERWRGTLFRKWGT